MVAQPVLVAHKLGCSLHCFAKRDVLEGAFFLDQDLRAVGERVADRALCYCVHVVLYLRFPSIRGLVALDSLERSKLGLAEELLAYVAAHVRCTEVSIRVLDKRAAQVQVREVGAARRDYTTRTGEGYQRIHGIECVFDSRVVREHQLIRGRYVPITVDQSHFEHASRPVRKAIRFHCLKKRLESLLASRGIQIRVRVLHLAGALVERAAFLSLTQTARRVGKRVEDGVRAIDDHTGQSQLDWHVESEPFPSLVQDGNRRGGGLCVEALSVRI